MSDIETYSTISDIREQVEVSLSQYFDDMSSGEFEGIGMYPENSKTMVAVFLAASANHSIEDIKTDFADSLSKKDIESSYIEASNFIGKDQHLVMNVVGIARKLDIPVENLVIT